MQLFIQIDDGNTSSAQGPFNSLVDGEKAFNKVCNKKSTFSAKLWNTNEAGEAVGGPIMSYEKD